MDDCSQRPSEDKMSSRGAFSVELKEKNARSGERYGQLQVFNV
jgi:hypothetical protein